MHHVLVRAASAAVAVAASVTASFGATSAAAPAPANNPPTVAAVPAAFQNGTGYFSGSLNDLGCRGAYEGRSTDPWAPVIHCTSLYNPKFNAHLKAIVARMWGNPNAAAAWERESNRRAYMVAVCEKLTASAPTYYLDANLGGGVATNRARGACLVSHASMEYQPYKTNASVATVRVR